MPKRRKTFAVADLKKKVNLRNQNSTCSAAERMAWNSILEDILMETGNYQGFKYYTRSDLELTEAADCLPGIVWKTLPNGDFTPDREAETDESRRYYY